jgi:lipopolysaccharide export system permease protein
MLVGELMRALLSILSVLVIIIVSRKFLGILARAIEGEVSGGTLSTLLGLKILTAISMLLPPALFLSVLVVLGRLYRDNEMTVLAACGVGPWRTYRAILWFVLPVALIGGVLALEVMPWSERQAQALMKRDEQGADVRGIKAGRFNEFSRGDVILYAEELADDGSMRNIFVQSRSGDRTGIVIAEQARMSTTASDEHFVLLSYGIRYQGTPGQADFVVSEFEEYAVRIDDPNPTSREMEREGKDSLTLLKSKNPREWAELQKRLAVPLGIIALGLLAVPLSKVPPRAGAWGNILKAFLIYVAYENIQKISHGLVVVQKIPLPLAYGGAYLAIGLLTLGILIRQMGWRWFATNLGFKVKT